MVTMVKICGLRTEEAAITAARIGADYVGFLFAPSKRRVSPAEAGALIEQLRAAAGEAADAGNGKQLAASQTKAVGVFVDPSQEELVQVLSEAPLDVVQLHGQETPELCQWVKGRFPGIQVWKVISILPGAAEANTAEATEERLAPYAGCIDGLLIDTHDPVYGGGSGQTFAWDVIPVYKAWCRAQRIPLFAAGGLTPDNARELIDSYEVDGVDVSSGVESDGKKDVHKMRAFVERVKSIG